MNEEEIKSKAIQDARFQIKFLTESIQDAIKERGTYINYWGDIMEGTKLWLEENEFEIKKDPDSRRNEIHWQSVF